MQAKKAKRASRRRSNRAGGIITAGVQTGEQVNWVNRTPLMRTFPDRMITTLEYFEAVSFGIGGVGIASQRYVATSPFKPSFVSSVQPRGYADFAALYASYRVSRSRIRLEVTPSNPEAIPVNIVIYPSNLDQGSSPSSGTLLGWFTQPYAVKHLCGAFGSQPAELRHMMTTAKIYGSEMVNTDDNFAAITSTSPVNNWFWNVCLYTLPIPDETAVYAVSVYIEFDVQFYDRKSNS
jgi:hypothetical protein